MKQCKYCGIIVRDSVTICPECYHKKFVDVGEEDEDEPLL